MSSNIYQSVFVANNGAIKLGKHVSCDGPSGETESLHVVSHAHGDHFEEKDVKDSILAKKKIVFSEITRELMRYCELNLSANNGYLSQQDVSVPKTYDCGVTVTLKESKHILGSTQIQVDDPEIGSVGYSGDFNRGVEDFIQVDTLVLDATSVGDFERKWNMDDVLEILSKEIKKSLQTGPVNICADNGLLQQIISEMDLRSSIPKVIGSNQIAHFSKVYDDYGFHQPEVLEKNSTEGKELRISGNYIWLGRSMKDFPGSKPPGTTFYIRNFGILNESPINKSRKVENQYNVGLSCHATLDESLEYIRNVNPKIVITDSFRNQRGADTLANQINGKFADIKASSSQSINRHS